MITFDQPYSETDPQTIRIDAMELGEELGLSIYFRLMNYVDTDTLREFIDDVQMGRIQFMTTIPHNTMSVHSLAVKVDVYPDEFKPLLKILNRAIMHEEIVSHLTEDDVCTIIHWLDDFKSVALEYAN